MASLPLPGVLSREACVAEWDAEVGQHLGSENKNKLGLRNNTESIAAQTQERVVDHVVAENYSTREQGVARWKEEVGQHIGTGRVGAFVNDDAATNNNVRPAAHESALQDIETATLAVSISAGAKTDEQKTMEGESLETTKPDNSRDREPERESGADKQNRAQGRDEVEEAGDAKRVPVSQIVDPTAGQENRNNDKPSAQNDTQSIVSDAGKDGDSTAAVSRSSPRLLTLQQFRHSPLLAAVTPCPVYVVLGDSTRVPVARYKQLCNVMRRAVAKTARHVGAFLIDASDDAFEDGVVTGMHLPVISPPQETTDKAQQQQEVHRSTPLRPLLKISLRAGCTNPKTGEPITSPGTFTMVADTLPSFGDALREVLRLVTRTPASPPGGPLVDPPCEVVLLVMSNPSSRKHWYKTSSTFAAVRALVEEANSPRSTLHYPVMDFRKQSERTDAPKRFTAALRSFREVFHCDPSEKRTAEDIGATLHVVTSMPFLRGKLVTC